MSGEAGRVPRRTVLLHAAVLGGGSIGANSVGASRDDDAQQPGRVVTEDGTALAATPEMIRDELRSPPPGDPLQAMELYYETLRADDFAAYDGPPDGALLNTGRFQNATSLTELSVGALDGGRFGTWFTVASVPDGVPGIGGESIRFGLVGEASWGPKGRLAGIVEIAGTRAEVLAVELESIDDGGERLCATAPINAGPIPSEATLCFTLETNGPNLVDIAVDLELTVPRRDPCPAIDCQLTEQVGVDCALRLGRGSKPEFNCGTIRV